MTKPRTSRVGPYEILALIGVGGMGEVYRAHDSRLKREVAIKFLPEELTADAERRARFEREARTLASLNHPNIAAIYGLEESADGTRGLVLELVEGPTLAELVARGPVATPEALSIAKQIADALAAAHEVGVVHRDLKPHNIKVRPDGSVKVLDFGLAKTLARDAQLGSDVTSLPNAVTGGVTRAGSVLGTPAYMSPEQTRGREVDQRSDVWAFGCVVYETLTGRRAFEGDDVADIIASVMRGEPDWSRLPADLPQAVEILLRRCLEKDPARRLRSIGDVRFLIEDSAARSLPPVLRAPSQPPSVPPSPPPREQRRMPSNGVIIAIVAGLVAITAIVFRPDDTVLMPSWPAGTPPQTPAAQAPAISAARSGRLPNSIAVLPFDTLNAGPDDISFAVALHLEVLNQLGKIRSLAVTSGSSVQRFADAEDRPPIAEIAADLGVSAVMQTTVRYAGNQIRLTAQLIDPNTNRFQSYDFSAERGSVEELFALQVGIATSMAGQLGADITAEERRRVDRIPTESLAAYTSYLRGLEYTSLGEFADAIRSLDIAVRDDSMFADAIALRGYIYAFAQISTESRSLLLKDERLRGRNFQALALDDADRALGLDADAGLAWLTRGVNDLFRLRYRAAGEAFESALKATPNDPRVLTQAAQFRLNRGDTQTALELIERAMQLDPNGSSTLAGAATIFGAVERTDAARVAADEALRLAPESLSLNLSAMLRAADMATAERFAAVVQRLAPEKGAWALMGVAIMYRRFGKEPEAIAALERYEMLANAHGAGDADWGQYYLMRGNFDAAHEKFESAVVKYEGGRADPGYAPVQLFMANAATAQAPQPLAEERFQDLLRRLRAVTQQ